MMEANAAPLVFAFLGPLFLLLGTWRCVKAGSFVPQGRTWLIVGLLFSAVAVWLNLGWLTSGR
jgi:hypothetical protein